MLESDSSQQQNSIPLHPDHIQKSHQHEWVTGSAIDPLLTSLSIISLEGLTVYDYLLISDSLPRRNDGRVSDSVYTKYFPLENGGWWCNGVDVLNNFEPSLWGQFKPNTPRTSQKFKGFGQPPQIKTVKYEPPPKLPTSIFALAVPLHLWQAIANRYQVPLPKDIVVTPEGRALGFWQWVIANPKIPLIITEGAKKAGAIITANYVAVALPGIYNGYRQPKNDYGQKIGKPYLIPELEIFAENGREIIFCFDQDQKPATIKNVRTAIKTTGGLFTQKGCKVSVINWNTNEKGVDDLIVAKGADFFHTLYKNRVPLSNFNLREFLDLSKYNPLIVDERYLDENLVAPSTASVIGLKSAKGTGKTEWIARMVAKATRQGQRVIVITHREQLAITLANRFGIDYRTEIRTSVTKGCVGYALCIDSLHPHANPPFNPDEWREALVIIDEAEQVFWHALDSDTCQNNRVAIIDSFKQLLQTAVGTGGRVILADADLSPIAIDYVRALIGFPVETWVVENKHNPNQGKRKLISYSGNDPRKLIDALIRHIKEGFRVLVHTTGQKAKSKWGSINLESYLKKKFPQHKILRIDRESVSEPGHPAYGCMDSLDQVLSSYDIVICSPVIETGVSIDLKGHFNSVWCIAMGVQTVDAVCQTTERLRDNVPRHIWIKTTAKGNRIGNGATSIKSLLYSEHKATNANIRLLQQADIDDFDDLDVNYSRESFHTWAKRACLVNSGKNDYRSEILSKLIEEGYELYDPNNPERPDQVNEELKQVRTENYQEFCQEVSDIEAPDAAELKELKTKRAKTKAERLKEKKGNLINRYGIEVTPELVAKDDNGWYNQLKLHYYLTIGNIYLAQRDKRSLAGLTENSNGKAFKPDVNKRTLSATVKALEIIDIQQFFDPEAKFTSNSLADWFEMVKQYRHEIKILLGVNINPDKDSPITVAQRILSKFGLKLELLYFRGSRQTKQRVYGGCQLDADGRAAIFANWLERDEKISQSESVLTLS
ncbi:MAG: DUF3854 domain-containing protein [Xenococcaceae cyanobacterium MO_188.B29]|nr:DUF3854 domain-containing protein [Xenococcaceae cyanobacterium MO_188.B29]